MGKWLALKKRPKHLATLRGIDDLQKFANGRSRRCFPQSVNLAAIEKALDTTPDLGPVLHLAGNRTLPGFGGQARVQNEGIGKFYRLAH